MDVGTVFIVLGSMFFLTAIALRWDAFRNHYKIRGIVKKLGETGATVFYVACGLTLVIVGILMKVGIIMVE
jgi:NADH:ubiquinone oxidoreductase subunit 2 (subunit N)